MGIEAIGGLGRIVSVAPSIGKTVGIGRIGLEASRVAMTPRAQILAREFSPIRIPRIDPPKPQIRAADVIAEAERIIAAAKKPAIIDRKVVRFPEPVRGLDTRVIANPLPKPQARLQPATETKSMPQLKRVVAPAPVIKTQTEQTLEKVLKVDEREKEKPKVRSIEKATKSVIQLVEAVNISEKRRLEIKAAIKEAKTGMEKLGLKAITGKIVAKLLSRSFWVHKSPIVGEGKDGTLPLTVYELLSDTTEYRSEEEAEENLGQAVAKHIPVKSGEGGRLATIEEVMEVIEGNKRPILEDQYKAKLVVIKRVIAKSEVASTGQAVNTVSEEKEEVAGEPTLKSLGLEELFPKAA